MTYSEFRYSLKEVLFPTFPTTVIINYNTVGDVTTIDDVAILIEDGNLTQLQEATLISLVIPELEGVNISINVESSTNPVRVVERGVVGAYYCYSILTPEQRPVIPAAKLPFSADPDAYNTDVIIEPIIATGAYNYNTYNPLIGNTANDRESSYIVYSDRGTTTFATKTNPVNIVSILSDQAIHANVQDSLYSDTGWSHARYEGSKLTTDTNYGTDPALGGIFFQGVFFGNDVEDATILSFSTSDLTYKEFFSVGKSETPRYELEYLNLNVDPLQDTSATQTLMYFGNVGTPLHKELHIGEVFVLSGSAGFYTEYLEMVPPTNNPNDYPYESVSRGTSDEVVIRVKRGALSTVSSSFTTTDDLYRLSKIRVYNIEGTITQPLQQGKMRIKGMDEVLYINESGYVVSGSNRLVT